MLPKFLPFEEEFFILKDPHSLWYMLCKLLQFLKFHLVRQSPKHLCLSDIFMLC